MLLPPPPPPLLYYCSSALHQPAAVPHLFHLQPLTASPMPHCCLPLAHAGTQPDDQEDVGGDHDRAGCAAVTLRSSDRLLVALVQPAGEGSCGCHSLAGHSLDWAVSLPAGCRSAGTCTPLPTSADPLAAAGEVKIVGLLLLSAMLLGEGKEFTLKMTLGWVHGCAGGYQCAGNWRLLFWRRCSPLGAPLAPRQGFHPSQRCPHCTPRSHPLHTSPTTAALLCSCVLAMAGFALYSHTKIQKFRESSESRLGVVLIGICVAQGGQVVARHDAGGCAALE